MTALPVITREVVPIPTRADDAHKGEVGRILVIGGCDGEPMMVGAVALAANAAMRSGAGLVQVVVPEAIRLAVATLAPCATIRTLPKTIAELLGMAADFRADAIAIGPGLGDSLSPESLAAFLVGCDKPTVVDADGLNLLAAARPVDAPYAKRTVLTPHVGEARRLLAARGCDEKITGDPEDRKAAACALATAYGCTIVLKGRGTIVTDGKRLYINETGNSGMATGGTGDVLTGVITALLGVHMPPIEAAILGVFLHGLAGDFAAEALGRYSMMAPDVVDFLAEAFCDHSLSSAE